MKKPHHLFLSHSHDSISLKSLINLYKWLRKTGRIDKKGAAMKRLKELKLMYKSGKRYFK